MPDKLLTTRELVDMLQLDRVTIYKMVKDGELPSFAWAASGVSLKRRSVPGSGDAAAKRSPNRPQLPRNPIRHSSG